MENYKRKFNEKSIKQELKILFKNYIKNAENGTSLAEEIDEALQSTFSDLVGSKDLAEENIRIIQKQFEKYFLNVFKHWSW